MRIGSLAVCMAAFSCAWVWRSGGGGLHGVELSCGAVTGTLFRQSHDAAKAMRFRRKLERIALDIFSLHPFLDCRINADFECCIGMDYNANINRIVCG